MIMQEFGVSFSIKQCRNFELAPMECLEWLMKEAGFKRFRLMSYWDEIERKQGEYDFGELDKQISLISKHEGVITLCLGARQPRWPENHWPEWVWRLNKEDRSKALMDFLEVVVKRYKDDPSIISYQLENEALLKNFGLRSEVERRRLRDEFRLVKNLDSSKPIIMTTSTSWGIPLRRPIGDIVGFSYYHIVYNPKKNAYTSAYQKPWISRLRAFLIRLFLRRDSFIHELQLEPWGPRNIWEMAFDEQMKSMNIKQITNNIKLAKSTRLSVIDLWGGEWWYWCYVKKDNKDIVATVLKSISN